MKISGMVQGHKIRGELILDVTEPRLEIAGKDEIMLIVLQHESVSLSSNINGLVLKKTDEEYCFQKVGLFRLRCKGGSRDGLGTDVSSIHFWSTEILQAQECIITII